MKHIKLFEDYSEVDLEDLMGDLGGVGLHKKWRMKGQIFVTIPSDEFYGLWETQIVKVFIVEVSEETEERAYVAIFNKLKAGDFTQDIRGAETGIFRVVPEVKEILSKENIIKCANGEANQQPMEFRDSRNSKVYQDGKIRWLMKEDLCKPTEEAIIENVKKYEKIGSDAEAEIREEIGWNMFIEEI